MPLVVFYHRQIVFSMKQTTAQIYLADQRGCSQMDWFRSFHTFNFGSYFHENKKPFGSLQLLNDNTLAAGKSLKMQTEDNIEVLILPLVGGFEYKNNMGQHGFVETGQALILILEKGMSYEIINPYEAELINFLQIWIKHNDISPFIYKNETLSFNLENKNKLLPIHTPLIYPFGSKNAFFIGKYEGRAEDEYTLKNYSNSVFVFIIEGAFEVANRLLETRDGIALSNIEAVEFEALSNDAILLLLEIAQ